MEKAPALTTASTVIGYARVSTVGQTLEQQSEALTAAGAGIPNVFCRLADIFQKRQIRTGRKLPVV